MEELSPKMKKVRAVQLDLLKELLRVCQKHNLRIWADSGTLIGTIRHKGFIPWDDDIDMAMPRADYEKLLAVADLEFRAPYFFQTAYNEKNYIHGHAQLRNSNTAAILPCDFPQPFNQGIFIDIFVLDVMPSEARRREIHLRDAFYRKFMYWRYYWYTARNPLVRMGTWLFAKGVAPLFNHRKMFRRWEMLYAHDEATAERFTVALFSWKLMEKNAHDIACYAETIYLDFEDMKIPVPVGYDTILRDRYGDYMTPVKAPPAHGTDVLFSVDKSYVEVLKMLRKRKK